MRSGPAHKRGFTLVELLVVIGIIALLVSILLPALNRARQHAQTIQCLSNMRQIGAACMMYSNNNNGVIIPLDYRDLTVPAGPNGYSASDFWPTILVAMNYLSYPPATTKDIVGMSTVFHCPSGLDEYKASTSVTSGLPTSRKDADGTMAVQVTSKHLDPGLIVYVWYALNGTTGTDKTIPVHRIPDDSGNYYWPRVTSFSNPTELVMMFDGIAANHMSVNANRVSARHEYQNFTNLLFFDGHGESVRTKDLPGGDGNAGIGAAAVTTFSSANLANYPHPHWRTDQ